MFFTVRGDLDVTVKTERGKPQLANKLGPGSVFGEIAHVLKVARTATV